jgi:cell division septation protein DedD
MHATATKTRTQRRLEKKQTLILLVLVLAVSLASFFLGAVVGRRGAERDFAQRQLAAEKILVAKAPIPVVEDTAPVIEEEIEQQDVAAESADKEEETKLTFYDNLAKEESVPLGSGINLPPQVKEEKAAAQPPIALPEQPIVKKQAPTKVAKAEPAPAVAQEAEAATILPAPDPKGSYAVQVGSFAAAGDAGAFRKKLLAKDYPAFVVEADLGAKGLWYRVKLGPYADAAAAKTVLQVVDKKEQIKGFVSRQ